VSELIYMVEVTLDRTGFDIIVNDIPAEHARSTHKLRMPINEFVHRGANTLVIEPSIWGSNADRDSPSNVTVKVTCDRIFNQQIVGSDTLIDEILSLERFPPPGEAVFRGSFDAALGSDIDMSGFSPIGPAEEQAIITRLQELADALQSRDAPVLIEALGSYFTRYENAYAHAERGEMAAAFERMLGGMADAGMQVRVDPRLYRRRGGMLVDCLGPSGAAIRATGGSFPAYDFWLVMGVAHGKPVVVA
jgi:hypothetical protein